MTHLLFVATTITHLFCEPKESTQYMFAFHLLRNTVVQNNILPRGTRGVGDDDNIILNFAFEYLFNKLNSAKFFFLSLFGSGKFLSPGPWGFEYTFQVFLSWPCRDHFFERRRRSLIKDTFNYPYAVWEMVLNLVSSVAKLSLQF